MGIHYTATKSKVKAKKKVGWKKEAEEYEAWKTKHAPNPKLQQELKAKAFDYKLTSPRSTEKLPSKATISKPVKIIHDPRVLYKEDPEMLERELKAREHKFTAAPIYNKGGDVLVTEEMMKDITAGTTRRR